jgi:triosephosphate isomerase (TIM)
LINDVNKSDMRTKIVAGNWKMNLTFQEADDLVYSIVEYMSENTLEKVKVLICPPAPYLELASDLASDTELLVGAQNISQFESGAYTGEISAKMIATMGVGYAIIGHSERRKHFNESHEMLAEKVNQALKHNVTPVFCCGEVISERSAGNHFEVVSKQIHESLFHLPDADFARIVIAYEPVWAIGTGITATPEQAQEMHAYIRGLITEKFGTKMAKNAIILYGGSCNAANARELFSKPDVDGGLIGGASLKADEFIKIIQAAS